MLFDESDDDIFKRLVSNINITIPSDVVDYVAMNKQQLLVEFNKVKMRLYHIGELLLPLSEEGRDLHSQYHALLFELKKRKVL